MAKKNAEEIKQDVKAAAETVETAVKETAAKAKTVGKETAAKAKTASKKAAAKTKSAVEKAVSNDTIFVQFGGNEIDASAVAEACKADYKAKGHRVPKNVTVYIKPEEGVAYYTVNGKGAEDFKVSL
jgi:hypothetical protein